MHNPRILRSFAGAVLLLGLSACSTIKSWFPDKERDYQFTSEIPELIVPDDLKNKGLASLAAPSPRASDTASEAASSAADDSVAEQQTETGSADQTTQQAGTADEHAEVVAPVASGASSLQVDQPKTQATRMVGRALSRQKMEIVERNIDKGYFYVKFDPHAIEVKDDSIWDEFTFMFGDDPSQEQEYRITVRQISEQMSEVTIQDSDGKTLSNEVANALLKLITDGINQSVASPAEDMTEEQSEQNAPEEAAPEPSPQ